MHNRIPARNQDKGGEGRVAGSLTLRVLNACGYLALLGLVLVLINRLDAAWTHSSRLQVRLGHHERLLERTRREALVAVERTRSELEATEAHLREQHDVARSSAATTEERLESLASREEQGRRLLAEDQLALAAELKKELDRLRAELESRTPGNPQQHFRLIQTRWDPSIYLIHSRFTYTARGEDGQPEDHMGTGWGTGFCVSPAGHIITNKHVIHPWKFDSELRAMAELGDVEVFPGTLELTAWPTGVRCMDRNRRLLPANGYNSFQSHNLRLVAAAPDAWAEETLDLGSEVLEYSIHALDDHDLALLKADGRRGAFQPVELSPAGAARPVAKLDPVMTLGFPRGQNGFERGIVVSSPTLGTVRKVEETIHVTAPIIPGNSGGPLFDGQGRVVGVATRIYSETYGICIRAGRVRELLALSLPAGPDPLDAGGSPNPAAAAGSGEATRPR